MIQIVVAAMCVAVFSIISWIVSSSKEKISEVKFNNNPNDINLLEKFALKDFGEGKIENAKTKLERLLENDKNNFTAIVYLSIIYYTNGEYEKSKKILYYFDENVAKYVTPDMISGQLKVVAIACYYLSHFYFLDGNKEKSEEYKNIALDADKDVINTKLH